MSGFPCVFCGANLDAGEKCDCERAKLLRGERTEQETTEDAEQYFTNKTNEEKR